MAGRIHSKMTRCSLPCCYLQCLAYPFFGSNLILPRQMPQTTIFYLLMGIIAWLPQATHNSSNYCTFHLPVYFCT